MKLYNVYPQDASFSWEDKDGARRPVDMTGIWLGSPGRTFRHVFIPVVVKNSHEPNMERWGISESRSGRPKIAADNDSTPGIIAVLSSYNGDGKAQGVVLVQEDDIPFVFVVASGIGGRDKPPMRWTDYLVTIKVGKSVRFLIEGTTTPGQMIEISFDGNVESEPLTFGLKEELQAWNFVSLDDPRVQRWASPHPQEN